ncbi:MAG: dienelactone hydrolase family protein [Bryobacteraceae bacterium]
MGASKNKSGGLNGGFVRRGGTILALAAVLVSAPARQAAAQPPDPRESLNLNSRTHFTPKFYSDLKTWEARREQLRRQILVSAGLWPLRPRPPVPVHRFGAVAKGPYTVEKIALETLPGFLVGANLYRPARLQRPAPAVLVAHGHWKHGRTHHAPDYSVPALCANLAAQGYVVLAWDMVGYGDTQQLPHDFGRSREELAWLFSPFSLQLWNAIRALDYVESLPEVNRFLIGMTGTSGGGTQTYLLAAIDERIRAAAPGGMVSAIFQGDDVCEMAPGLRIDTNNVELTSLIAPRYLMLVAATRDWTRNTPQVELPAIRSVYALYRQERRAWAAMIDAGHNSNRQSREAVYGFFHRTLMRRFWLSPAPAENSALPLPSREELLIGDAIRDKAIAGRAEIFAAWRRLALERTASMTEDELRERLATLLHVSVPAQVVTPSSTPGLVLIRTDTGTPVRARWAAPPAPDASAYEIAVSPEGLDCADCARVSPAGQSPPPARLVIEAFRASAPSPPFDLERATFHRSLLAERIQDIYAAVSYVKGFAGDRPIRLLCHGDAQAWCLLALAAAPGDLRLDPALVVRPPFAESVQEYLMRPGVAYAGGMATMLQLARRGAPAAARTATMGQ